VKFNWLSKFSPFLLSEVGSHPNSSAVNHKMVDTYYGLKYSSFPWIYFRQELSGVCHTKAQHMISLTTRPRKSLGKKLCYVTLECEKEMETAATIKFLVPEIGNTAPPKQLYLTWLGSSILLLIWRLRTLSCNMMKLGWSIIHLKCF